MIDVNSLVNVVWLLSIFVFFIYGQRLQMYLIANDISRALGRLKIMRDKSRKEAIDYFTSSGKVTGDPTQRIDEFLDYVTIMPVDMDPNGIVGKLQHITNTRDDRVRAEVSQMIPNLDPTKISVAENILEIATSLNQIHKVVQALLPPRQEDELVHATLPAPDDNADGPAGGRCAQSTPSTPSSSGSRWATE